MRFCVYYHHLNVAMIPQTCLFPRMEDPMENLVDAKIAPALDAL